MLDKGRTQKQLVVVTTDDQLEKINRYLESRGEAWNPRSYKPKHRQIS